MWSLQHKTSIDLMRQLNQHRLNKKIGNITLIQQHIKDELFNVHRRVGVLWKMKTILLKHTNLFRTVNYWTKATNHENRQSNQKEIKYCYEVNNLRAKKQRKSSWIIPGPQQEIRRKAIQARQSLANSGVKSILKIDQNHQIIRVKQNDAAEALLKATEFSQQEEKQDEGSFSSSSSDSPSLTTIKEIQLKSPSNKKSIPIQFKLAQIVGPQRLSESVQKYVKQRSKEHRKLIKKQGLTNNFKTQQSTLISYPLSYPISYPISTPNSYPILPQVKSPKNRYLDTYFSNKRIRQFQ